MTMLGDIGRGVATLAGLRTAKRMLAWEAPRDALQRVERCRRMLEADQKRATEAREQKQQRDHDIAAELAEGGQPGWLGDPGLAEAVARLDEVVRLRTAALEQAEESYRAKVAACPTQEELVRLYESIAGPLAEVRKLLPQLADAAERFHQARGEAVQRTGIDHGVFDLPSGQLHARLQDMLFLLDVPQMADERWSVSVKEERHDG